MGDNCRSHAARSTFPLVWTFLFFFCPIRLLSAAAAVRPRRVCSWPLRPSVRSCAVAPANSAPCFCVVALSAREQRRDRRPSSRPRSVRPLSVAPLDAPTGRPRRCSSLSPSMSRNAAAWCGVWLEPRRLDCCTLLHSTDSKRAQRAGLRRSLPLAVQRGASRLLEQRITHGNSV